ncbi:MAG: flagellar brake protein [Methylobacter sp.]|uniref:flagellar brake protein n=1 Tax=Methylobacter sp. TaxID=2051955 RepID=UPI0027308758|nr:flagellar brake protein [Methylobacter sp.]MDP1665400.1 flagellar brake protein [Methylobacter sp.]
MLTYQANHADPHHKCTTEPTIIDNAYNNYTVANQDDIRKKLNHLLSKNALLSIKVPGKFATSTLLTMITCIEGGYIFLGGFQNERFNKDLLMQSTVVVSANLDGIAVSFILSEFNGHDIDATFNLKAPLPQSIEWVQRRDARRVKVPINIPVKMQYKNQAECFNVTDISVTGLSYINQFENQQPTVIGGLHTDCNIILPDKSILQACLEIVNNKTMPLKHTRQISRVGCEIKRASYRLDTALQRLINQIDFHYQ